MQSFIYQKEITVSNNILERIDFHLSLKKEFGKIHTNQPIDSKETIFISYIISDHIGNDNSLEKLKITFEIAEKKKIITTTLELLAESTEITELHLKWYVQGMLTDLLTDDRLSAKSNHITRNYIRYFNAFSINDILTVNTGIKTS